MSSSAPSRAIVTGASGFVGRRLAARIGPGASPLSLRAEDWRERLARTDWRDACVYHLAARVHEADAHEADFERDNVEKTAALAESAARGGASRLVFLSTIKVNGEETRDRPFRPDDAPAPSGAYACSKWKAEQALAAVSARSGLAVVIVRSPLVIGAGAAGNLRALLRLAASPWPLPFAALRNRRTFVTVQDLAALLAQCGAARRAPGKLFFAGDPRPMSTADLLTAIRKAWERPAGLFGVSANVLEGAASVAGQAERMRRLTRCLEIDVSRTQSELGWMPALSLEQAIAEMALAFRGGVPR